MFGLNIRRVKIFLIFISIGIVIGIFGFFNPQIVIDSIVAIITGIVIVPLVLIFNNYLEFNQYLRLLTKEIKDNLKLIDDLSKNLQDVRDGKRAYLPGIGTNQPQPGYALKYLSLNVYNDFLNQKYRLYVTRSAADRLAELYEITRQYCDIVQRLQLFDNSGCTIARDSNTLKPLDVTVYDERRFLLALGSHDFTIKQHAAALNLENIQSFKDPEWWTPIWLKNL